MAGLNAMRHRDSATCATFVSCASSDNFLRTSNGTAPRMTYVCERCGYETMRKYNFDLHLQRKTPCVTSLRKLNITDGLICKNCSRIFTNRQAKYRHMKKNTCVSISRVHPCTYTSFETPLVDHIDADVVKDLYLSNCRSIKKLLNEVVRKVYKDRPSNNSFRFPMGVKSRSIEVVSKGKYDILPFDKVVQVVLRRISELCAEHLEAHYHAGTIVGTTCMCHAKNLRDLCFKTNDENVSKEYYPCIKAAILECSSVIQKF